MEYIRRISSECIISVCVVDTPVHPACAFVCVCYLIFLSTCEGVEPVTRSCSSVDTVCPTSGHEARRSLTQSPVG